MDGALCVHKDVRDYLSLVARAKAVELGATAPAGTAKAYAAFLQWGLEHPHRGRQCGAEGPVLRARQALPNDVDAAQQWQRQ